MNKLAILTIGQTPRSDLKKDLEYLKSKGLSAEEYGLLDGLSAEEIQQFAPSPNDKDILVTVLQNGKQVFLSKSKILRPLQSKIDNLAEYRWILLLCTGDFNNTLKGNNIIYPDKILTNLIKGINSDLKLGIIGPDKSQKAGVLKKWHVVGFTPEYAASSPYNFNINHFKESIERLQNQGVELIVLDCMGYTNSMKDLFNNETKCPILVSRELIFNLLPSIN